MPIPQSGWGLTPGTLEKNVTRSLGGKYGAIGKDPGTISDMLRTKYASGLQAKSVKEASDLAKNIEATRKAESTRAFGLDTEKFGFTQSAEDTRKAEAAQRFGLESRQFGLDEERFGLTKADVEQKWADALRTYNLASQKMTGEWEQNDLARELDKERLRLENLWNTASTDVQRSAVSSQNLARSRAATAADEANRLAKQQAGRDQLAAQRAIYDAAMARKAPQRTSGSSNRSNYNPANYVGRTPNIAPIGRA